MDMRKAILVRTLGLLILTSVAVACAGQSPEPETPASEPTGEEGGEHTMPDGTKMEGEHHHGDHSSHTMPDGTKMEGHEHPEGDD